MNEEEKNPAATDQPPPVANNHPAMWPLLIEEVKERRARRGEEGISMPPPRAFQRTIDQLLDDAVQLGEDMSRAIGRGLTEDMLARHEKGCQQYGVPLQPFNGHNQLIDAYQELLDFCVYLRTALYEMQHPKIS